MRDRVRHRKLSCTHRGRVLSNKRFYSERNALYRTLPYARCILNAGCGSGAFARYYPYPNSFIVNVDNGCDDSVGWPAWGIRYRGWAGWLKLSEHWLNHKNVIADVRELDRFPSRLFDMAVLGQVIEHMTVDDAHLVIEDLARVIDDGGYLQIDTPNPDCPIKDYVTDHTKEYTAEELKALVDAHGFKLVDFRGIAGDYCWWAVWQKHSAHSSTSSRSRT